VEHSYVDNIQSSHGHKDFPLKEKSRFSGMLRLEKIMIAVLSGLNGISHSFLAHLTQRVM
jgi:hypothetical protein